MSRFAKIDCVLQFSIISIDVKKPQEGLFMVKWVRGEEQGQSDAFEPDKNNILQIDSTFECPITLYQSKSDGRVKEKDLRISLYRFTDPTKLKLYGKLHTNVAKAYGSSIGLEITSEMETGHSIAPVIQMNVNILSNDDDGDDYHGNDSVEGFSLNHKGAGLDDWDLTENGMSESEDDRPSPKRNGKHESFDGDDDDDEGQKVEPVQPKTQVEYINLALKTKWPEPKEFTVLNEFPKIYFPPETFPMICCIVESGALSNSGSNQEFSLFRKTFQKIFIESQNKLSSTDKLLTVLAVYDALNCSSGFLCLDNKKIEKLFKEPIEVAVERYLLKKIAKGDLIINRFATARFEFDSLLSDFKNFLKSTKDSLKFTTEINKTLYEIIIDRFEVKMINKLLANPRRFTLTNSAMWNTLISAVEGDLNMNFHKLKQIVSALVMAPNMTKDHTLYREICPDIDVNIIAFILLNYVPDDVITEPLNPLEFFNTVKIFSLLKEATIEESPIPLFKPGLFGNSCNWQAAIDLEQVSQYPFFRKYYSQ